MTNNKLDLADVQKQIYNWRINKSHNNMTIPTEIKQSISALIGQYSGTTIRRMLGLSGSQYKQLQKNNISNDNCKDQASIKPIFKKIILPTTTSIYQAVIENNNGCKLKLQLSSINELAFIITNFIGGKTNASIS